MSGVASGITSSQESWTWHSGTDFETYTLTADRHRLRDNYIVRAKANVKADPDVPKRFWSPDPKSA